MQDLSRMGVFAVVAEELSLSKAAEKIGCSKSAVSKQISALEAELGVKLLYRDMRRSRLTDEGLTLSQGCSAILQHYREVKDTAEQVKATPTGTLLLQMPDSLAKHIVLPKIGEFRQRFPLINLQLRLSQASFKTISEDLDVAVVSGTLPDSSVVCRNLGNQTFKPYASKAYLQNFGKPNTPEELATHQCIVLENSFVNDTAKWHFQKENSLIPMDIQHAISVNDMLTVKRLVLDGVGISILQDFAVTDEVEQGELVPLLPDYQLPLVPVYIIYPERKHVSPKIRAAVDFLCECFTSDNFLHG